MPFGDAPISLEELASKLRIMIPKLAGTLTNEGYTRGLKEALQQIGNSLGVRTLCKDKDRNRKEFMLEVVWWSDVPRDQRAVLGVESDWGSPMDKNPENRASQVMEKFEKLLLFKAPIKLILFSASNPEVRGAIHSGIQKLLINISQHVRGEQYLFMEFAKNDCYTYRWTARETGQCTDTVLEPMDKLSENIL